jgi:hypothetical protein
MQRVTGQVEYTHEPQNVHFHSMYRAACIRQDTLIFLVLVLSTCQANDTSHFRLEHMQRLNAEFG